MKDDLREKLAQYAHEAWSGWMDYLFTKGTYSEGGTFTINDISTSRWMRQSTTQYCDLPENEKASDRDEADKIIGLFAEYEIAEITRLRAQVETMMDALHKIADHSWFDEIMRGEPAVRIITPEDYERKYYEFMDIAKDAIRDNK